MYNMYNIKPVLYTSTILLVYTTMLTAILCTIKKEYIYRNVAHNNIHNLYSNITYTIHKNIVLCSCILHILPGIVMSNNKLKHTILPTLLLWSQLQTIGHPNIRTEHIVIIVMIVFTLHTQNTREDLPAAKPRRSRCRGCSSTA
jgi:hypothetical protein